jgi:hypothetical protein
MTPFKPRARTSWSTLCVGAYTLAVTPSLFAQLFSTIELGGQATSFAGIHGVSFTSNDSGSLEVSRTTPPSAGASITLSGEIQPGVIRARAQGAAVSLFSGMWEPSVFQGAIYVANSETLLLSAPGFTSGSTAQIRYSFFVPGSLQVGTTGSAISTGSASFWTTRGGLFQQPLRSIEDIGSYYAYRSNPSNGSNQSSFPADRILTYEASVTIGESFLVSQHLSLSIDGQSTTSLTHSPGSASADVNFGNSAYWNGVSAVTIDGVPVTDFTLLNSSGIDFSDTFAPVPVPEPETYAFIAASTLLLGAIGYRLRCPRS